MSIWIAGLIVLVLVALTQYVRKILQRNKINALKSDLRKKSRLNIVITGGSKGLGFALVKEFLRLNENNHIVFCATSPQSIESAFHHLETETGLNQQILQKRVFGISCDISNYDQVNTVLIPFIQEKLNHHVDVWINNAASGDCRKKLEEMTRKEIEKIVNVNTLGTIYCVQAAIKFIKNQSGEGGHVFVMEGLGSDYRASPEMSIYGMTKASYRQFVDTLCEETKDTKVGIHRLQPGMVITRMLVTDKNKLNDRVKRIFNILAEDRDVVARYLCSEVSKTRGTNTYSPFLTKWVVLYRFLTFFARKNRFFDKDGKLKEQYANQW
ncbi:hypothetical protein C9374_012067 [Naegleria lovaniensis]|uniref:Uncharacterized protein n=1 Tax=Naegleria lovaniensis TaxID=51637 RepID=A0AA88KC25_NAELO|nr:uncharacterized protein C9374_012067 [Naegleria lovaniensis]KAG2373460.1 hypothetical protein C9374_012067 [Naegleria lovaniensis]